MRRKASRADLELASGDKECAPPGGVGMEAEEVGRLQVFEEMVGTRRLELLTSTVSILISTT
jgi:hypothetical protein